MTWQSNFTTDTLLSVSFETFLRRHYDVPIRRGGDIQLRRLGDVPSRRPWVFHFGRTCDVAGTYRETSLRRRYGVLIPSEIGNL